MTTNIITKQKGISTISDMEVQTLDDNSLEENKNLEELPDTPLDTAVCIEITDHNTEPHHATRSRTTRKVRTEEVPFVFKASSSSDAIENPTWTILVNQLKGKHKKTKNIRHRGLLLSLLIVAFHKVIYRWSSFFRSSGT